MTRKDRVYALLWCPDKGTVRIGTVFSMERINIDMFVTKVEKPENYELPLFIAATRKDALLMKGEFERVRNMTFEDFVKSWHKHREDLAK